MSNSGMTIDKADERGVPSLVWRAGQDRRLEMIKAAAGLTQRLTPDSRVLVDGCGVGMYVRALRQFTNHVYGLDIEFDRVAESYHHSPLVNVAAGEHLPYPSDYFDLVLSHEVIEHVQDDRSAIAEMLRVLKVGGRAVIFCPNRGYPVETHGIFWKGKYYFGNKPFVNYLPRAWRDKLAPHVRVYSRRDMQKLFDGLPVKFIERTIIFGAYDNIIARTGIFGKFIRTVLQFMEATPLRMLGLSHFWVVEKV